ncbi:putative MFS family arabinose efflux permease [Kitasatospora sp. GP30]|uniref:MFS transporter n=1 Tax=Kitasatospora sp. GP30 TaxID=3035084 RepID=UPI0015D61407|nr:MFS transporter [Kitasatospora sp. GP30]MDH6145460.1 putative MFS family arabinose efflux permease [Kitasatospora sp. GP30]
MKRDFRWYLLGQTTSAAGSALTTVALPYLAVHQLAASTGQTGVIAAAPPVVMLLFGFPLAGWLDRRPRKRRWLVRADLLACAALFAAAVALAANRLTLSTLTLLAAVLGACGLVVEAGYFAHLRTLVPGEALIRARGWLQGGEQVGGLLGRAVFGLLITGLGATAPFICDAASFAVSAVCLLAIRTPDRTARPAREAAEEPARRSEPPKPEEPAPGTGRAWWPTDPALRRLLPAVLAGAAGSGAISALLAPYLLRDLAVPGSWYGMVFVLAGATGLVGSALGVRLTRRLPPLSLAVAGLLGVALTAALLPLAAGPWWLATVLVSASMAGQACCGAVSNIGLTGYVTVVVPEAQLGRAGVSLQILGAIGQIAGALGAGLLASSTGATPVLWLAVALGAAGPLWLLSPRTRAAPIPETAGRP